MDFGRPNVEIGWKMANGRLLFLALLLRTSITHLTIRIHTLPEKLTEMHW